ncbi:hypothetical protein [Nocardia abscessus]|uniref:hypothetical protein n=1 Tax=Nocardia abscessus TaxID=120957 RepID=UPI0024538147|nr:hypothetical protein [Nocardia abscessus]
MTAETNDEAAVLPYWADDSHLVEHPLAEPGTRVSAATDNRRGLGMRRVRAAA